ncbi:MAG: DUF922 domain-containing protein [Thermoproteota archaeon]
MSERLKKHEEGHSKINDEIVKRLGSKIFEKKKDQENAVERIRDELSRAMDKASNEYDSATEHGKRGTPDDQGREADKAIEKIVEEIEGELSFLPLSGPEQYVTLNYDELSNIIQLYYSKVLSPGFVGPALSESQMSEINSLVKALVLGIDLDLPFGRNAEHAVFELTILRSKIEEAERLGDVENAWSLSREAIKYGETLMEYKHL